jgi:oligopeptide/dipeptide ABC transporter ATP-binding protein
MAVSDTRSDPILRVLGLKTSFFTSEGTFQAVNGVDFEVKSGKVLGLVGESGCGKTVTALSVMRLVSDPPGRIVAGKILFQGTDLLTLTEKEMQSVRGKRIAMIFQEPMTSLNPVFTVGNQIMEMLTLHLAMSKKDALARTIELLTQVGIPSPHQRVKEYPHQLSGGMRQRVMIAMAISCHPELVFADEPTTALDVTIQAQILNLLKRLREELGMAMVLISHDLGVIAEVADEVAIMYAGRIVEYTSKEELFANPLHPYTQGLLASLPRFDMPDAAPARRESGDRKKRQRLKAIPGMVPRLSNLPPGCTFHPRCPVAIEVCHNEEPQLLEVSPGHKVQCWLAQ